MHRIASSDLRALFAHPAKQSRRFVHEEDNVGEALDLHEYAICFGIIEFSAANQPLRFINEALRALHEIQAIPNHNLEHAFSPRLHEKPGAESNASQSRNLWNEKCGPSSVYASSQQMRSQGMTVWLPDEIGGLLERHSFEIMDFLEAKPATRLQAGNIARKGTMAPITAPPGTYKGGPGFLLTDV
jgi:hypothetical protein